MTRVPYTEGRLVESWRSLFRVGIGAFWLFFASQKWTGIDWMRSLIEDSAKANPVPVLHDLLVQVVVPNWQAFALAQAAGETLVGALLVLGLLTRPAACLGTLLAIGLALTVAFITQDVGSRWLYYLAILANAEVAASGPGSLAVDRFRAVARSLPAWARP